MPPSVGPAETPEPSSSISGAPAYPGCEVPSISRVSDTSSLLVSEILCGPLPIANSISSSVGAAFASSTASRSVQVASQVPSPGSAAELTVKTAPSPSSTATADENSEVLSAASVAVAVTHAPRTLPRDGCEP